MSKTNLLTKLLLLCLCVVGSVNAWAETVTWTITADDVTTLTNTQGAHIDVGSGQNLFQVYAVRGGGSNKNSDSWVAETGMKFGDGNLYKSGIAVYIPSTSNDVESIQFYLKKSADKARVLKYIALDAIGLTSEPSSTSTQSLTTSFASYELFDSPAKNKYYTVGGYSGGSGDVFIQKIVVTFETTAPSTNPTIDVNPSDATYAVDATPTALTVTATKYNDANTLYYQWYKNTDGDTSGKVGDAIDDATSSTLAAANISTASTGTTYYYCIVTEKNGETVIGSATSAKATISVVNVELTSVKINGSAISASDLSTLKDDHALTVDGSDLNGIGMIEVAVSYGDAPTVTRANTENNAVFTFTYNDVNYTITVTDVKRTYTAQGDIVYYSKNGTEATISTVSHTLAANGITFTYASKDFSYGKGTVTIGSDVYKAIKLSTGEPVNVTFPTGKKAKKIIVYGWAADGDGWLKHLKETSSSDNKIFDNVSYANGDKFYATCATSDIYPSVYTYDLKNYGGLWSSAYFHGSTVTGTNPFVVMDFVFANAPLITTQPTSADYTVGDTSTALSVVALSSDDDPVSYQWYSCDENGDNEEALTDEDDASYAPSTASAGVFYYFCRVTDGNGSTDTELASVKVTAATETDIFSYTVTASDVSTYGSETETVVDLTAIGGTCSFNILNDASDSGKKQKGYFTTQSSKPYYCFGGNAGYVKVALASGTFKAGDVVSITGFTGNNIGFTIYTDNGSSNAVSTGTYSTSVVGTVTAELTAAYNNATEFYIKRSASKGIYISKVTVTRPSTATVTTNGGNWASFTPSWNCTLSSGATAYIITNIDKENSKVTAKRVEVLEVGKGYFIKGETASTPYTATATTAEATSTAGNLIVGCLSAKDINGNGNTKYVLGTKDGTAGLYNVNSSITIPAGKSYLDAGEVLSARALTFGFEDEEGETTGIRQVESSKMTVDSYYDLSGRKVAQPTKGLYIVNGRKVVIK